MRNLFYCRIDEKLLTMYYYACILSVLNYCLIAWDGNNAKLEENKINRLLKAANNMLNKSDYDTCDKMFKSLCNAKINKIIRDESHPLSNQIVFSKRSGRTIHMKCRTSRYLNSLLPTAVRNFRLSFT